MSFQKLRHTSNYGIFPLEPTTQAELEAAIQHCTSQLQSVLKIKDGLVIMMRSYEKANDEKSAKILAPQIAEKDLVRNLALNVIFIPILIAM